MINLDDLFITFGDGKRYSLREYKRLFSPSMRIGDDIKSDKVKKKKKSKKVKYRNQKRREKLLKSQESRCYYCKEFIDISEATIDHKIPISMGGSKTNLNNLCVACKPCNSKKGNSLCPEIMGVVRRDLDSFVERILRDSGIKIQEDVNGR